VVWSPDGKQIASGSDDTTIKIWDLQSGDCKSTLTGHSGRYVFFSIFFVSLSLLIRVLTSHNYRVTSVAWSEDGKLASGSYDKTVKIWSVGSTGTFECESTLTGHSSWYVFFMTMLEKNNKKIMFLF
jgi:hypothetical protein